MKPSIVDTHAHLDMRPFEKDRDDVISRAREAGVTTIVTVGIDLPSSRRAIELAEANGCIFATVGIHPHEADSLQEGDLSKIEKMASHPRVVAIGETGLDFYRNRSPRERQVEALEGQLELASKLSLPVVIHSRQADGEMRSILQGWTSSRKSSSDNSPGVIHCFNGGREDAEHYVEMGFYIAFGAYIGYTTSRSAHDIIRSLPLNRLLVETDCPYLPPQKYRGKRNEPAYVASTVEFIAGIRGLSFEEVAGATTQNAIRLFRLPGITGPCPPTASDRPS